MASVQNSDALTIRIYKTLSTNPSIIWANTYELLNTILPVTTAQLQAVVNGIAAAESYIHLDTTRFIRGVVSTLIKDSSPYDPTSFIALPLTQAGQRSTAGVPPEPLQMCYRVAKSVDVGRQGFFLYRNCLTEGDVSAPAGVPTLQGGFGASFTSYKDALLTGYGPDSVFEIGLMRNTAATIRVVTDYVEAGVTVKKFNNRYFDQVLR